MGFMPVSEVIVALKALWPDAVKAWRPETRRPTLVLTSAWSVMPQEGKPAHLRNVIFQVAVVHDDWFQTSDRKKLRYSSKPQLADVRLDRQVAATPFPQPNTANAEASARALKPGPSLHAAAPCFTSRSPPGEASVACG